MGSYNHKVITVIGWSEHYENAYKKATQLFNHLVTESKENLLNGYKMFSVAPSGSKEGWDIADIHDLAISKYIEYLESNECTHDDNSSGIEWVIYGIGDYGFKLEKTNSTNKF